MASSILSGGGVLMRRPWSGNTISIVDHDANLSSNFIRRSKTFFHVSSRRC
jgi:hypothetical protein